MNLLGSGESLRPFIELSDLEDRVRTLEEQEKQEDEKRRERKECKASREAQSCPS